MSVRRNILIFILLILCFILVATVGYEVSWGKYTVDDLKNLLADKVGIKLSDIFVFFALLTFIPFVLKVINRWSGLALFSNKSRSQRFVYFAPVPSSGKSRIITYTALEMLLYLCFTYAFFSLSEDAFVPGVLTVIMCIEQLLFLLVNYNRFGVGLTNNGAVVLTREMYTIPYDHLVSIEKDFNELFFNYPRNKNVKIPLVYMETNEIKRFISTIRERNTNLNLFISDNLTKQDA